MAGLLPAHRGRRNRPRAEVEERVKSGHSLDHIPARAVTDGLA
ncbi:hypothetical protein AB0953_29715 [Streptomyces sp. NPDC046866]